MTLPEDFGKHRVSSLFDGKGNRTKTVPLEANESLPSMLPDPTIYVTGHNPKGQATVQSSGHNEWSWLRNDTVGFNVVYTNLFDPDLNGDADITFHKNIMSSGTLGLVQPGGSVCRIVDFGPSKISKPLMHRTQSLDFGIVLEGEIEMELDDGSVTRLNRGDVAIQRGTMHAWRNPSSERWARMLFMLQDCRPVTVGSSTLKEDLGHGGGEIPRSHNDS